MKHHKMCVIVTGPTGSGKTDFVEQLAPLIHGEIVNADMGQFYTPLTIGTAKPSWRNKLVMHHLFDILKEPVRFSVLQFRQKVHHTCKKIWNKNKLPIIVGGSSYYIASLFFPPHEYNELIKKHNLIEKDQLDPAPLWQKLYAIDPERARAIDCRDQYRIKRALDIWENTGIKPSQFKPKYMPIAPALCIWIDRDDLYERINDRVLSMLDHGWVKETESLLNTPWEIFLLEKKIIGYPEIIQFFRGQITYEVMVSTIQKKTRNYAKRQRTFWRMLRSKISKQDKLSAIILEANLTQHSIDYYIEQIQKYIHEANG